MQNVDTIIIDIQLQWSPFIPMLRKLDKDSTTALVSEILASELQIHS